ncbi:MAG: ribose-5-phosphate isomerase RpiA [Candidatus Hadarchaeales archaeon]
MDLEVERWKREAGERAAGLVKKGMVVGLGSGTTVAEVVAALKGRKSVATFVPASSFIERVARRAGLKISPLCRELDLAIDGADEVDRKMNLLKGKGGALTREKILLRAARRVAIVVDETKLVGRLGEKNPVPVEIFPFAAGFVRERLRRLGGEPELRRRAGRPFVTDNGNYILDAWFGRIDDPAGLEREINEIPGVVENGIFTVRVDLLIIGGREGTKVVRRGSK